MYWKSKICTCQINEPCIRNVNGRKRKRRKSFHCGSVLISKVNILINFPNPLKSAYLLKNHIPDVHVCCVNVLTWLLLNLFPEENGFWRTSKGRELLQRIIKKSLFIIWNISLVCIFHSISLWNKHIRE